MAWQQEPEAAVYTELAIMGFGQRLGNISRAGWSY